MNQSGFTYGQGRIKINSQGQPENNKISLLNNAILRFVIILHETFLFQLKSLPEADASI
jgi:hypothetical protein